jgi:hypothetical protein
MISRAALPLPSALLLAATALVGPAPARAEEPSSSTATSATDSTGDASVDDRVPTSKTAASGRVVGGHIFMPAQDVPGALLTTSFLSGLLVGVGSTTGTTQIGDQVLSGTFDYAAVGAVLAYEYAFLDHFSARVGLTESIFSGTTGRSAIVIGSELQAGFGAGATFSLPVGDKLRMGLLFDLGFTPNVGLTVGNAIKGVINNCQTTGCSVDGINAFQQKNVTTLQPSLAANWAPIRALGLTGNFGYLYANQKINGTTFTGNALTIGLAADLDLYDVWKVPIGLQVQYSWTAPKGSTLQHVTDLGGGIFYTGRKNLALGVQVINRRFAVTPDVDVSWKTYIANIGLRYYW